MDRMTDEPDVVVEEYEEVIGNLDELSDRAEMEDAEAESIQEPTSIDRRNLTTHPGRPSLRSTNARLAGSQEPRRVETGGCNTYPPLPTPVITRQQHGDADADDGNPADSATVPREWKPSLDGVTAGMKTNVARRWR